MTPTTTTKKRRKAPLGKVTISLPDPPRERRDELPELDVYFFDEKRRYLTMAPVEGGMTTLEPELGRARLVRAVIAPRGLPPQTVSASKSLPSRTMEAKELATIELPHGWWEKLVFGFSVPYHGRVEKVIGESALPIREGIVEVYEVDPWMWIIEQPDLEIARLRDDLLRLIDPSRIPELEPDPGPWPGPGPIASKGLLAGNLIELPSGESIPAAAPLEASMIGSNYQPLGTPQTALTALQPMVLEKLQGNPLRAYLTANKQLLTPFLYLLVPDWWYRKDKIGEVPIQPDGTFSGSAGWWRPGLDRPDLYFRVRQVIEGTDKTIFSPPIACNTWWNYAGQDVVLRVTHPDAVAVDDSVVAELDQVVFFGVGFDTTTDVAGASGLVQTGPDIGLYRKPSGKLGPYARQLHIVLDVDLYGLRDAGVTFYRLSYHRGVQAAVGDPADWTILTTPINRHYREIKMVGGTPVVSYPVVSMVPAPADVPSALTGAEGIFSFADPVRDYVVIRRSDRAFGIWDTEDLPGPGQDHGDVADPYTMRLELFDASGNDITATTPVLRIKTRQPDDTYTTTTLDSTKPFLYLHVDNRPMVAEIRDEILAGSTSTGTGCGFLLAGPGEKVEVGVQAYHPGGVGYVGDPDRFLDSWHYKVTRGAAATVRTDETVTDKDAGSPSTWQTVPYADIPRQTVNYLLRGVNLPGVPERRCTFNVRLEAFTMTRNGYSRLDALDRADNAVFALLETP